MFDRASSETSITGPGKAISRSRAGIAPVEDERLDLDKDAVVQAGPGVLEHLL